MESKGKAGSRLDSCKHSNVNPQKTIVGSEINAGCGSSDEKAGNSEKCAIIWAEKLRHRETVGAINGIFSALLTSCGKIIPTVL